MAKIGEIVDTPAIDAVGDGCCGCGACAAACPISCLKIKADAYGFVRPVYENGCIGCGRCAKVCPVLAIEAKDEAEDIFWAKAKAAGLRARSSSGAVFGLLAESVLRAGGTVYGAAFSDDCKSVRHVRVDAMDGLDSVMRSKYVQSTIHSDVYEGVEGDLRDGREVLFSGTACQIAAMRNYVGLRKIKNQNLLLIEVICHGAPSPRLWAEWLDYVSRSVGAEVDGVNFRSKSTGWLTFSVAYYVATEKVRSATNLHDWYMRAFLRNASLRHSCLVCPAKRCCGSDITLGDFWGVQVIHPEVVDDLGVSAVICNTGRGRAAFDTICGSIDYGHSSMDEVLPGNPALVRSVEPNSHRDDFLSDVAGGMEIDELMDRWSFEPSLKQRIRSKLSRAKRRVLGGGRP